MAEASCIKEDVEALAGLNIDALRTVWRSRFNDLPPQVRSGDLIRRFLAERIQLEAVGTDPGLQRDLDRLIRDQLAGRSLAPKAPSLKPGTFLVREWQGQTYRVEVLPDGYLWNDQRHSNLSVIARAITGARWNGPRFFGLREPSTSGQMR